jgi:parallel beta-helix repeat protein
MRRSFVASLLVLTLAGFCSACGKPAPTASTVVSVSIAGAATLWHPGQISQLSATAHQALGTKFDVTKSATWQSTASSVVAVSRSGVITAVAAGSAAISASYQGEIGILPIVIATPASLAITGPMSFTSIGQLGQLIATAALPDGTMDTVTSLATWQSSDVNIVTVSGSGLVTSLKPGALAITATFLGRSATAPLSVAPSSSTSVTSCETIVASGRYALVSDLTPAAGSQACLSIGADGVDLDCGGHTIRTATTSSSAIAIAAVRGVTINNCQLVGVQPGPGAILDVSGAQNVVVSNTTISGVNTVWVDKAQNVTIRDCTITANLGSGIYASFGNHNSFAQNQIDGRWDGNLATYGKQGTDDGVLLWTEDNDTVEDNTIRNVYDAGVETVGLVTNSRIRGNTITNAGFTGIGAYHSTSWIGNMVEGNQVSASPSLAYIEFGDNSFSPVTTIDFSSNTIEGNGFQAQTPPPTPGGFDDVDAMLIVLDPATYGGWYPMLPVVAADNLIANNVFPPNSPGPFLSPVSAFVNGGGNTCNPNAAGNFLTCSGSLMQGATANRLGGAGLLLRPPHLPAAPRHAFVARQRKGGG